MRLWRETRNSDAKDRASNRIGLDGTTAQSVCGGAAGTAATLVGKGRQQSAQVRSWHPADGGEQWRTVRRLSGAARMLIAARPFGRHNSHKHRGRDARMQTWTARMVMSAGRMRGRLPRGQVVRLRRGCPSHWNTPAAEQSQHQPGEEFPEHCRTTQRLARAGLGHL